MGRNKWCVVVVGTGVLAACGADASAKPEPNPATQIAPPTATTSASAGAEWTMPTGVFRSDNPQAGLLELHVKPGVFLQYDVTQGSLDLGYAAECVADDPSTVTCTERSGLQLVFAWTGTSDALEFTLVNGAADDRRVWEGAPWIRVP